MQQTQYNPLWEHCIIKVVAPVHAIKVFGSSKGIAGPFLTSTPDACK